MAKVSTGRVNADQQGIGKVKLCLRKHPLGPTIGPPESNSVQLYPVSLKETHPHSNDLMPVVKNNTSLHVIKDRTASVDKRTNSGGIRKQVFSPTASNDERQKLKIQTNGTEIDSLVHTAYVVIISPKSWHLDLPLQEVNILYKILKK